MEMNQFRGESEPFSAPYAVDEMVNQTDQKPELDSTGHNRVFRVRNSPGGTIAASSGSRRPFPVRTLIVCFTIWLIATQIMIFDEVKFEARLHLLEQEARSLGGLHMVLPNEPTNPPTDANVWTL